MFVRLLLVLFLASPLVGLSTSAHAQYTSVVKAGFDALKASSGVSELGAALKMARTRGLIEGVHGLEETELLRALEQVKPGITESANVRYVLENAEAVNLQSREVLAYSEDLFPVLKDARLASFRAAFLSGGAPKVSEGILGGTCATGLCPTLGDLGKSIEEAAGQAAGLELLKGTVESGPRGTVIAGFPVSGSVSGILSKLPNANVAVRGLRTTSGPAAFVPHGNSVFVKGTLKPLAQAEQGFTHQLVAGGRSVLVNAETRGIWNGWVELSGTSRSLKAVPTNAP